MKWILPAALLLSVPAIAAPQGPDVAIAAAATGSGVTNCRFTDVQDKLVATGQFNTVDLVDVMNATPTLADLLNYDAVIVWSNGSFASGIELGDVMADYVDAGGGVVVAVFATSTTTADRFLEGRWITGGYEVIQTQGGNMTGQATLGNVQQPMHPIMTNVSTFDGGTSSFRPTVTQLLNGGSLVAEWSDGIPLIAVGQQASRVDLGMYPPSSDCSGTFWDSTTDGATIMANALSFAATGGGLGVNFCMANANSTGAPAEIAASGGASIAVNNVVLECGNMPQNAFAFALTSMTQAFVANPAGSAGNLCLGGAIGRYVGAGQIQNSGGAGMVSLGIDLTMHPTPTGLVSVQTGETWNFTWWFRDTDAMGNATSNFSDGLEITFN